MISIYHGDDAETHRTFQAWRRANVDGFDVTEGPVGTFSAPARMAACGSEDPTGGHHPKSGGATPRPELS
jgi:hypothetical protein